MKLRLTLIDWEYPENGRVPEAELWEFDETDGNQLMALYLAFANGTLREMKVEGDCEDAVEFIQGLALGAGSCQLVERLGDQEIERLWLYEDGYMCYRQGSGRGAAFIFVQPKAQP